MPERGAKPIDLIGQNLREAWSDTVALPLPDRLRQLLDAIERTEKFRSRARARLGVLISAIYWNHPSYRDTLRC